MLEARGLRLTITAQFLRRALGRPQKERLAVKQLLILGGGTAGSTMANRLRRRLGDDWSIRVVDRDNEHIYQPGLLFVPFGTYRADEVVRPRDSFLPDGVELVIGEIEAIDTAGKAVQLAGGRRLPYDLLIIATGARVDPSVTEGLDGPGWRETAFDFYTLEGASALARAFERWDGGRLVIDVVEMPIKCPVAPLELAFLADHYFHQRGIRDEVEIVYATPLDAAFTKPRAAAELGALLERKNIKLETSFAASRVDGERRRLIAYDGREIDYDLLVAVPTHAGSPWIARSGIGDELGFVPTDRHTLECLGIDDAFALGDTTDLPTSKAGSVAHFQADVLIENVDRTLRGLAPLPGFDGHANCFIETGFGKAILIDFNYETEPLPGRFPLPGLGPFSLLRETAINHWGKLGFKWVYWNLLVRGHDLPIDHRMLMAGKAA